MKLFTVIFPVAKTDEGTKILLGKQKPGHPFAGYFNGYGGKVEEGESIEDAAKRELDEELGIDTQNLKSIGTIVHEQKKVYFFLSLAEYREYASQEAMEENTWFLLEDKEFEKEMLPGDGEIIASIRDQIDTYFDGKELREFEIIKTGKEIDEATKELDRRLGPKLR